MTFYGELCWESEAYEARDDPQSITLGERENPKMVFVPATDTVYLLLSGGGAAVKMNRADLHMVGAFAGSCERHRVRVGVIPPGAEDRHD